MQGRLVLVAGLALAFPGSTQSLRLAGQDVFTEPADAGNPDYLSIEEVSPGGDLRFTAVGEPGSHVVMLFAEGRDEDPRAVGTVVIDLNRLVAGGQRGGTIGAAGTIEIVLTLPPAVSSAATTRM